MQDPERALHSGGLVERRVGGAHGHRRPVPETAVALPAQQMGAGLAAQLVDGALGMAYGVISTALLVSRGVDPALASASVHAVEVFTTGASGVSHVAHKNVNWKLLRRIAIPGMIGGALGAYALSNISAATARPFVLAYLAASGLYLFWRGLLYPPEGRVAKHVAPLGLLGGFLDAAGGGGWGPVVTSNLLIQGADPRKVVGTVNTVEFFLTVTVSAAIHHASVRLRDKVLARKVQEALIVWWLRRRDDRDPNERAFILALIVMATMVNTFFLRSNLPARFGDAAVPVIGGRFNVFVLTSSLGARSRAGASTGTC